jgi:HK97 family phage major capsid protein
MRQSATVSRGIAERLAVLGVKPSEIGRVMNVKTEDGWTELPKDFKVPSDPDELKELIHDENKIKHLVGNGKVFGEVITAYATQVMNEQQDLRKQVMELTQNTIAEWLKDQGADQIQRPDLSRVNDAILRGTDARNALHNPRAMGAQIDNVTDGFGDYFRTIWHNTNRDAALQNKLGKIRAAFSSTVPSEGGFLIPETLRSEILRVSLETGIMRSRARVIPMESLRVPFPAIDSSSNVSSVFGGVVCYWTAEGAALTASSAAFAQIVLEAAKLTAYAEVPNELIADSIGSFEAFIGGILPEAMSFYEDDAFFNGSGVGEPLGIMNSGAMISVAKEAAQPADTILWENIINMYARMLPTSISRAVWVASIDTFPQLATMALNVGVGGSAVWLNNGVEGPAATILGRPVIFTEKLPTLGNAGDIAFIDPGFYLIGDRQVMSAMSSPHYAFGSDKTAFRVIERVDGRPWLNSAITPKNGGNTLSPFVQIAERA